MPMIEHDLSSAGFHAYKANPYVMAQDYRLLGCPNTSLLASHILEKAEYHFTITATKDSRLFDMSASAKKIKNDDKKQRPTIDRSYYRSDEFKRKLELTIDAALADQQYQEEIHSWNNIVSHG